MVTARSSKFATIGGLNLTSVDDDGVVWQLEDVKGWGSPGGSLAPVRKPRGPGTWSGVSNLNGRAVALNGTTQASTEALAEAALDALIDAVSLDETLLEVTSGGRTLNCMVRRDGEVLVAWPNKRTFYWSIQVHSDEARKFGGVQVGSTALPSTTGGLRVPFTVPFLIAATQQSGQVNLANDGNTTGPVLVRIDGPVDGPILTHVGVGDPEVWSSSWAGGAGEFLIVDMERRTVLANGQESASRNNTITSRNWFGFDRGPNTFAFTAKNYTPTARATFTATPSWE